MLCRFTFLFFMATLGFLCAAREPTGTEETAPPSSELLLELNSVLYSTGTFSSRCRLTTGGARIALYPKISTTHPPDCSVTVAWGPLYYGPYLRGRLFRLLSDPQSGFVERKREVSPDFSFEPSGTRVLALDTDPLQILGVQNIDYRAGLVKTRFPVWINGDDDSLILHPFQVFALPGERDDTDLWLDHGVLKAPLYSYTGGLLEWSGRQNQGYLLLALQKGYYADWKGILSFGHTLRRGVVEATFSGGMACPGYTPPDMDALQAGRSLQLATKLALCRELSFELSATTSEGHPWLPFSFSRNHLKGELLCTPGTFYGKIHGALDLNRRDGWGESISWDLEIILGWKGRWGHGLLRSGLEKETDLQHAPPIAIDLALSHPSGLALRGKFALNHAFEWSAEGALTLPLRWSEPDTGKIRFGLELDKESWAGRIRVDTHYP